MPQCRMRIIDQPQLLAVIGGQSRLPPSDRKSNNLKRSVVSPFFHSQSTTFPNPRVLQLFSPPPRSAINSSLNCRPKNQPVTYLSEFSKAPEQFLPQPNNQGKPTSNSRVYRKRPRSDPTFVPQSSQAVNLSPELKLRDPLAWLHSPWQARANCPESSVVIFILTPFLAKEFNSISRKLSFTCPLTIPDGIRRS